MDNVRVSSNGGDDIMSQIAAALNATEIEVLKSAETAANTVSKQTARKLKQVSPKGKSGNYAKGWTTKKVDDGYVVYNDKAPGLAHLLNNGHDVIDRNGRKVGRTKGDNHITNVEREMIEVYVKDTQNELQRRLSR